MLWRKATKRKILDAMSDEKVVLFRLRRPRFRSISPFWHGIGSISLYGVAHQCSSSRVLAVVDDEKAIHSDWVAVGEDIQEALSQYAAATEANTSAVEPVSPR